MSDKSSTGKGFAFLNAGSVITGEILVENDLAIEGSIKGTIRSTGTVSIHAQGQVEGEVHASSVKIAGKMTGNVTATDRTILEPKSSLVGDLRTRELVIHEGAHFHGTCDMQPGAKTKT
ncbi:MAG: polymer-forming cytoskeletal protein [Fibrobacteria bacterium]|nr:polymer-forming cytoskeletal protein [Fibrobacteria bacterium]